MNCTAYAGSSRSCKLQLQKPGSQQVAALKTVNHARRTLKAAASHRLNVQAVSSLPTPSNHVIHYQISYTYAKLSNQFPVVGYSCVVR
jgi:hypothetical protein